MRMILALMFLPLPAPAWEFSPDPICTLTHQAADAEIAITYDDRLPQYTLYVTLREGLWPDAPSFQMGFVGPRRAQIGTALHRLSADRATLTVQDRGFGNVLDGLEFNRGGYATVQGRTVTFDLTDVAPAIDAFRACPDTTPATS